jgi:hypothetical protein
MSTHWVAVIGPRVRRLLLASLLSTAFLALAVPPLASAEVLTTRGKHGASSTSRGGDCWYRNTGLRGYLVTRVWPPTVTGANLRRRHKDRTWVHYRAELVDAADGHRTLASTGYSSWLRVREGRRRTWSGLTSLDADWRGSYRIDVLVEWWNRTRRVGYRWHRVKAYNYYDEYNVGPFGPFSSCYRAL